MADDEEVPVDEEEVGGFAGIFDKTIVASLEKAREEDEAAIADVSAGATAASAAQFNAIRGTAKKFSADGAIKAASIIGHIFAIHGYYSRLAQDNLYYNDLTISGYAAKQAHLIEIPDAGTMATLAVLYDMPVSGDKASQDMKDGFALRGFSTRIAEDMIATRRHRLSAHDYWTLLKRGKFEELENYNTHLRMAGLFTDDMKMLEDLYHPLLPPDALYRDYHWGEQTDEQTLSLLMHHGFEKPDAKRLLDLSHARLPLPLIVQGAFRGELEGEALTKRLKMMGLHPDDHDMYMKFSRSRLPAALALRKIWRAEGGGGGGLEALKRLGIDDRDLDDYVDLSKELLTRADLDRLFFAGKMSSGGYEAGLKRLGLHPEAAAAQAAWPWTPTPPGEVIRLRRLGSFTEGGAIERIKATGIDPLDADAIAAWPWGPTDLGTMRRLYFRNLLWSNDIEDRLKAGGLRPDDAKKLSLNLNDPLPPPQLIDLFRRGEIDENRLTSELWKHGYSATSVEQLKKLVWVLPSPGAVINWAVKDVFEPDVVEHFGYDEEFPPEFQAWAAKAGIPEDQARMYWWAHWYVPGVGQVMDMLHRIKPGQRGVDRETRATWVDDHDVDVYLKTQDYPPWWRAPLKAISYHPISRIDIRRVYHAGQMDIEDVYDTYRALGYSHYNSTILTEWVKSAYRPDSEQVAVDRIRDSVVKAEIEEAEARSLLATLDVPDFEQDNLIAGALYERERAHKDLTSSQVRKMYQEGLIDEEGARTRLLGMQYGAEEVDLLLADWRLDVEYAYLQAQALMNKPTRAQHDTFFEKDVIGEQDWRDGYAALGYGQPVVSWYWTLMLQGMSLDELIDRYANGRIYRDTLRTRLIAEGLTPGEADTAIRHIEEAM